MHLSWVARERESGREKKRERERERESEREGERISSMRACLLNKSLLPVPIYGSFVALNQGWPGLAATGTLYSPLLRPIGFKRWLVSATRERLLLDALALVNDDRKGSNS